MAIFEYIRGCTSSLEMRRIISLKYSEQPAIAMSNASMGKFLAIGLVLLGVIVIFSLLLFPPAHAPAPQQEGDLPHTIETLATSPLPSHDSSGNLRARIEDVDTSQVRLGTDSPVRIRIANTGELPFSEERIDLKIGKDFFLIGYQERSYTMTFLEPVEPGSHTTLTMLFNIPASYSGVSLAGTYTAEAKLYINDVYADSWKGTVKLS
jgi:hypothetical protein